jgi:hypothetical protein
MSTQLTQLVKQALPELRATGVTYNAERDIYLTTGYTSQAGNTYFQGIRLSDRVLITYSIGVGYCHTFLNEVSLYGFDGTNTVLIGSWTPLPGEYEIYTDYQAQQIATQLLFKYLKSQAQMNGNYISDSELQSFAVKQIKAGPMKCLS